MSHTPNTPGSQDGWSLDPQEAVPPLQSNGTPDQSGNQSPTKTVRSQRRPGSLTVRAASATLQPSKATVRPGESTEAGALPPGVLPRMFGEYTLLEEIARGGMGVVYKAKDPSLGRVVALKMILEGELAASKAVERFYQEARAAAALDHPNIVPIYDIGQHEGRHYFTMAFIEGGNLKSWLREKGPLAEDAATALMADIADGVAFAHERGMIHRDLKPDNILLDLQGRPRITDFGLAKIVSENAGLTATGVLLGTPAYMSPEQALGGKRIIGPPSDVYALGGILYFLLTGRAPFQGDSITEVLYQVVQAPPDPLRQLNPQVSPRVEAICLKCLEKEPADRYPSAAALAQDLRADRLSPAREVLFNVPSPPQEAALKNAATPGWQVKPPVPQPPPPRRSLPLLWGALGAVAAGVLIALGAWLAGAGVPGQSSSPPGSGTTAQEAKPTSLADDLKPSRRDFQFKFEILGGFQGDNGIWNVVDGQRVQYRLETDVDAYVGVWDFRADGTFEQLFPFEESSPTRKEQPRWNHFLKKGELRLIPGSEADITAVRAPQPEHLVAVATTEPWDPPKGQKNGPYFLFQTDEEKERVRKVLSQTRGMHLKPSAKGQACLLTEVVIKYQVLQKPK